MDCLNNCPYIKDMAETQEGFYRGIEQMNQICSANETLIAQNKTTEAILDKLAPNPETVESRRALSEAAVQIATSQQQAGGAIVAYELAIEASNNKRDIVMGSCPGEPTYFTDPERPGQMILACASRAITD